MNWKRIFKPWICAAQTDERPTLTNVNVTTWHGQDVIVACDGFVLSVIPCELEGGDVPGVLPARYLKDADGMLKKSFYVAHLSLQETTVVQFDGTVNVRFDGDKRPTFPDFTGIIPFWTQLASVPPSQFLVDPFRLQQVMEALSFKKKERCTGHDSLKLRITRTGPQNEKWSEGKWSEGPMLVETGKADAEGWPVAPFACIMPMRCAQRDRIIVKQSEPDYLI